MLGTEKTLNVLYIVSLNQAYHMLLNEIRFLLYSLYSLIILPDILKYQNFYFTKDKNCSFPCLRRTWENTENKMEPSKIENEVAYI